MENKNKMNSIIKENEKKKRIEESQDYINTMLENNIERV